MNRRGGHVQDGFDVQMRKTRQCHKTQHNVLVGLFGFKETLSNTVTSEGTITLVHSIHTVQQVMGYGNVLFFHGEQEDDFHRCPKGEAIDRLLNQVRDNALPFVALCVVSVLPQKLARSPRMVRIHEANTESLDKEYLLQIVCNEDPPRHCVRIHVPSKQGGDNHFYVFLMNERVHLGLMRKG